MVTDSLLSVIVSISGSIPTIPTRSGSADFEARIDWIHCSTKKKSHETINQIWRWLCQSYSTETQQLMDRFTTQQVRRRRGSIEAVEVGNSRAAGWGRPGREVRRIRVGSRCDSACQGRCPEKWGWVRHERAWRSPLARVTRNGWPARDCGVRAGRRHHGRPCRRVNGGGMGWREHLEKRRGTNAFIAGRRSGWQMKSSCWIRRAVSGSRGR